MLRHIPKRREQFGLVRAGHELNRAAFVAFLNIFRREQDLSAEGLGVEHGDANDLRGERP